MPFAIEYSNQESQTSKICRLGKEKRRFKPIHDMFVQLAKNGYGDDVVYDQAGTLQVVFRLEGFTIYVDGKNVRVENE